MTTNSTNKDERDVTERSIYDMLSSDISKIRDHIAKLDLQKPDFKDAKMVGKFVGRFNKGFGQIAEVSTIVVSALPPTVPHPPGYWGYLATKTPTRPDSLPDHLSYQGGSDNNGGTSNPNENNGPPNSFGEYGRPDPSHSGGESAGISFATC